MTELTQADLDTAIAKQAEKHDSDISGLKAKNAELIAANRELKKGAEIKPEDLTAAEDRADKAEASLADVTKQVKTMTAERDKAIKSLADEGGFTRKLLVENGLREALAANGVTNAAHQKAAMAMLSSGVEITADGDSRVAKVGDKALAAYVKEWAGGDEGKHFVAAPGNSGGGAHGGKPGAQGIKIMTRSTFDALDQSGRAAFAKDGGQVVDQAA